MLGIQPACQPAHLWSSLTDLQAHRIAHDLWVGGRRMMALALQSRMSEVFAVDIHPGARFGSGIVLDNGTGVVIGETAVLGDNVSILQGVTLGGERAHIDLPGPAPGIDECWVLGIFGFARGAQINFPRSLGIDEFARGVQDVT
jgi:serine O-acetyltransferase